MTAKEKIAVTLPPHLVKAAKDAVRAGRARSVSAFVSEALEARIKKDDLLTYIDEMLEKTGGPMTPAERRMADRTLRGSKRPRW